MLALWCGKSTFPSRAEEAGHGGGEPGWLDGVHQVPGRDRHQLAVRDERGHVGELALVDVAGRTARDEERRGLDPPQLLAPGAGLRVGELVAQGRHVPVERQRAFGPDQSLAPCPRRSSAYTRHQDESARATGAQCEDCSPSACSSTSGGAPAGPQVRYASRAVPA
jgi:hypothetical protein